MKTKIKKNLLVVFMLGTLINYASEKTTSNLKLDVRKVKIEFETVKKGENLTIKDASGAIIYNQKIEKSGHYKQLFDFTALENGVYTTELNKDFEIIIKSFKVEGKLVSFLVNKETKIYKPFIRSKDNMVFISKINFENKPVKVLLYYEDEVILSEALKGEDILTRVYQLSETEKGDYKVVINSDDRTYIKNFSI